MALPYKHTSGCQKILNACVAMSFCVSERCLCKVNGYALLEKVLIKWVLVHTIFTGNMENVGVFEGFVY